MYTRARQIPFPICLALSLILLAGCKANDPIDLDPTGTIVINPSPDSLDAPWIVTGPNGFSAVGQGDSTLTDAVVGDYQISWQSVPGWVLPPDQQQSLSADASVVFAATYVENSRLPFAGSEAQLMSNFRTAYEDMDYDSYQDLLNPDYIMLLQPSTQALYPDLGPTIDRTEDLHITERMFSGEPVIDPDGNAVPAFAAIDFIQLEQFGAWATSPANDAIPNARYGIFDVLCSFARPGFSTLRVNGQIKFYVAGRDSLVSGTNRTFWQIIGLQDLTGGFKQANEDVTWGSVKALFR